MIFLYWLISIVNFIYLVTKKRNIDLFTVTFLAFIYYNFPAFFGNITFEGYIINMDIDNKVYYFLIFVQILFFIVIFIHDKKINIEELEQRKKRDFPKYFIYSIFLVTIMFYLVEFYISGINTFLSVRKTEVDSSIFYGFGLWGALISFFLGVRYRYNFITVGSFVFILFSLFVGSRAYIATAILGWLVLKNNKKIRIINSWKNILFVVTSFLFLVFYKTIFKAVKTLDLTLIIEDIKKLKINELSFFGEANAVMSNLNIILVNEYTSKFYSVFDYLIYQLPFSGIFLSKDYTRFSEFISNYVHPNIHFGMASNFWGEIYSVFGNVGMYLSAIIWVLFICFTNALLHVKRSVILIFPAVIYSVFYIHRVDVSFVTGAFQANLFISLLSYLFYFIYIKQFVKIKVEEF